MLRQERVTQRGAETICTTSFFEDIENYFEYNPRARWLELGCGSYQQSYRKTEESMCIPRDVESLVQRGWHDVTGVDLVPLGKNVSGWRFIEGDLLEDNTWKEIGGGYNIVSAGHLISFYRQNAVSPGFRPLGIKVYANEFMPEKLLDSPHYFFGVDYLLRKSFNALTEGGLMRINSEHILRKAKEGFVAEDGFCFPDHTGIDLEYLCSKKWSVPLVRKNK